MFTRSMTTGTVVAAAAALTCIGAEAPSAAFARAVSGAGAGRGDPSGSRRRFAPAGAAGSLNVRASVASFARRSFAAAIAFFAARCAWATRMNSSRAALIFSLISGADTAAATPKLREEGATERRDESMAQCGRRVASATFFFNRTTCVNKTAVATQPHGCPDRPENKSRNFEARFLAVLGGKWLG